jgi:hypothetical protein
MIVGKVIIGETERTGRVKVPTIVGIVPVEEVRTVGFATVSMSDGAVLVEEVGTTELATVPPHSEATVSSIRVIAAERAKSRPCTVTALLSVIEAEARMFPRKFVAVPSVAELPTWK